MVAAGPVDAFAFIIHPVNPKADIARKWPLLGRLLTESQINFLSRFFPPVYISQIEGIRSEATGKTISGHLIACPYTPKTMRKLPPETVYKKIIACGHQAEQRGARILGLGAFTAVVGDAGVTIARELDIPVTTGDSYTVYTAVESMHAAARAMNIDLENATVAVIGANGAIGAASSELFSRQAAKLILIGRRPDALAQVEARCTGNKAQVHTSLTVDDIYHADLILTASSAVAPLIHPEQLKPGAVVCDMAVPRAVATSVARTRDDVFVFDGGAVQVPGPVNFNFDLGMPDGTAYACIAETMALALEGRFEDYTLGRNISAAQVDEIAGIAARHGFQLAGFRSFDRDVTEQDLARVRAAAKQHKR